MWVSGDRRATPCHADTLGILPHGLRALQAVPAQLQPPEPTQPTLHFSGTPLAREHGSETQAHQDSDFPRSLKKKEVGKG